MKTKTKAVGLTKDAGFQVGARKTFSWDIRSAWDFLLSDEGLKVWLGNVSVADLAPRRQLHLADGSEVMLRLLKPDSHLRMSWRPKDWTNSSLVQVRVIKSGKRTTIAFHQDQMVNVRQREQMKKHWDHVLTSLEKFVVMRKTIIKSCFSHLGGKFGNALAVRLEELGWIARDVASKDFTVTAKGQKEFLKLGLDMSAF